VEKIQSIGRVIIICSAVFALQGCIKSAEVRSAEDALERHENYSRNKYRSACETEARTQIPVSMQYVRLDPPTLQDCSWYQATARMICENGNQQNINLYNAMSNRTYDANARQRKQFTDSCISRALIGDAEYQTRKTQLESTVKSAERKQAANPWSVFAK